MGENVNSWSKTAASNSSADSSINWAENQLPGTVNNSARSMMAAIAKFRDDNNGTVSSTGSANAYLLTANTTYTALAQGLAITFKANFTNSGASTFTLTPNGAAAFAAKAIRVFTPVGDIALKAGQIASSGIYILIYDTAANSAAGAWILINSATANTSGDLYVTDFGAVSGAANNRTEFQAAYDACVDGQRIIIPAGTWTVGSALTLAGSRRATWIQRPGAIISSASLVNVTGMVYATAAGAGEYFWNLADDPWTGKFIGFQDHLSPNTSTGGQNDAVFLFGRNTVALASGGGTVTFDCRGYVASTNTDGYCFAQNTYALIESGGDGVLVGDETDLWNEGTEISNPFFGKVKIGRSVVNQGPKVCTTAYQLTYGVGNKGFYNGYITAYNGIDHSSATSVAFEHQDVFTVWENGDVTIGKPSKGDLLTKGIDFTIGGSGRFTSSGAPNQIFQARTGNLSSGDIVGQVINYGKDSGGNIKTWSIIQTVAADATPFSEDGEIQFVCITNDVSTFAAKMNGVTFYAPDNTILLGYAGGRWKEVFSVSGTINTSDAVEKDWLGEVDDRIYDAVLAVPLGFYQWKASVASKGKDAARYHYGVTAQSVRDTFEKYGLDAARFGLFCADPLTQEIKKTRKSKRQKIEIVSIPNPEIVVEDGRAIQRMVAKTIERPMFCECPIFDEAGEPVMVSHPAAAHDGKNTRVNREQREHQEVHREPVMEDYEEEYIETAPVLNEDGSQQMRYGLRYDQFDRLRLEAIRRKLMAA